MESDVEGSVGADIREAVILTKREMALEADLVLLNYNYHNARTSIENQLAKILIRKGELLRKGEIPWR